MKKLILITGIFGSLALGAIPFYLKGQCLYTPAPGLKCIFYQPTFTDILLCSAIGFISFSIFAIALKTILSLLKKLKRSAKLLN